VNSPWSGSYTNNGDHSAQSVAVGLNNQFTTPLWQANNPTPGIATAICFK
jgi:hypothetical protein